MGIREAQIERMTTETKIRLSMSLDGSGSYRVQTGVPFFDHMLELFSKHGLFDLELLAQGDLEVDSHHTVEDVGLTLGQAIKEALGDRKGIRRYGSCLLPMDETLVEVAIDLGGRAYLAYNVELPYEQIGNFDSSLVEEFFVALVNQAGMNLHINLRYGKNSHHIIEAVFKAYGRALDAATTVDPRSSGVPSTKGVL